MTRQTTSSDDAKEDGFTGLRTSIFGTKHQVPKWVPVTLLAFSSVALVVPIIMLRRYRRGVTPRNLQEATAPPRRGRGSSTLPVSLHSPAIRSRPASQTVPREVPTRLPPPKTSVSNEDNPEQFFNGPLYTLKALSIATALVTLGATASIWGVMKTLNARDANEFAERMRHAVLTKLPVLAYQIYRPAEIHQDDGNDSTLTENPASEPVGWNWQEAEDRLREAFDKGGFHSWASAALVEVEAEATVERAKRGFTQARDKPTS
ncbi:uncharacterized protein F5891DRAFT_1103200 [Suillus fuscotomentosus]|uniref:Uncharacterized protein n=1 Tax=Suillus fuscotomentosus TaxID=1912939 RepID=A0AAD4HP40_9AGAM|nr:uncharacterized protein F5891DRAFT_1103200 [Suillus fuscotomentosus]KAG1904890.1 hypothetical protein F5891DRAFT_1103200 [Suillus fuscotomentosus]